MADNAFVKIGTALLKHQVKKLVGEEALGAIGEEIAEIGGDKLDAWLGDKSTFAEIEKAAKTAETYFHDSIGDHELEQWMVSLPIGDLPKVLDAIEKLPTSPDEKQLESAIRESVSGWRKLSPERIDKTVNSFLSCLRGALLPIEKQTLMVIGHSVLRTEDKIDKLTKLVEQLKPYSIETQAQSRFISVGGNVQNSVVISGDHNIVYYYAANGEKREMRTGWFFGHQYPDMAAFTGRVDELKMLDEWLVNKTESLLIINAFGGFGKSALTWHWLNNNIDKATWPIAIWWSFYEKESGFESFLVDTLNHLGLETKERSARQQVNDLLAAMQTTNILIVLDGFERLLRQYGRMDAALQDDEEDKEIDPSQRDCTSQSAETFLRGLSDKRMMSKVLMTSRLFPRALEGRDGKLQRGCREVELKGFSPDDSVEYFHNEGVTDATRAEIIEVCSAYGYHPLSLTILVGWINREDGNEHRGDIVEAKNLDIFDSIKARRDHILERAYGSLAPEHRDLLSKISCFRGSMEYAVLKKVFPSFDLDKTLLDLRKRGLLQYAGETGRYDMHPIVRHYAYDHFTDEKRRKAAHIQLAEHFVDVMPMPNTKMKTLEELAPVIELYHHMVGAGNLDEALKLFQDRLAVQLLYQFGAYQLRIELLRALFLDGEDAPPRLKDATCQGWSLNALASTYSLSGQPHHATDVWAIVMPIVEKLGEKGNVAVGLGNVATQQLVIGALGAAERNLRRRIDMCREIADEFNEAIGHQELGRVLSYRGVWQEAEQELEISTKYWEKTNDYDGLCIDNAYRSLLFLLQKDILHAISYAQKSLDAWEKDAKVSYPTPRTLVRTLWLFGAAYRTKNELTLAEENLSKALDLCRQINSVDAEADILLDVARLRYAQGDFKDAQEKASETLIITERCGYVLQGADVNLFLAQYTLEQEKDKVRAKEYAERAKELAYCDGGEYKYKVAYDEAEKFLKELAG